MQLSKALLPDGRTVHCVNNYEVDFSAHEIFSQDLSGHGLDMTADGIYLDVGANIGLFSMYIMDRCPRAKVFAFEPMPSAFAALELNTSSSLRPSFRFSWVLAHRPASWNSTTIPP